MKNGIELKSEFARVRVSLDMAANGPRLRVEDLRTGDHLFLDPLEIEGIAAATHEDLAFLVNPSRRWNQGAPDDRRFE
jgi:hypothetical protein